ncbi:MAG: hypothetical protein GY938_12935 [Ketobacter sp.]|nr:hypothetical protein [Ketobacter sp.]
MAITGPQLLQDAGGELARETFPQFTSVELDAQLVVWADAGNTFASEAGLTGVTADSAAFCWAYYLAYLATFQRLIATPESTTIEGQGSVKLGSNQANAFKRMADQKKDCAEDLANQEAPVDDNVLPGSVALNTTSYWGVR